MPPDYFEVLPLHPQPQPLESLTSYLIRLAQANGIPTAYRLHPLLFPHRNVDTVREMQDLPLRSFDALPGAALCTEATLRGTTFYHLVQKFDRPLTPAGTALFLHGHLASHLRYCPRCLQAEQPYYSLTWRFLMLPGCARHGCRLLDRCSHCGRVIPFLATPLKMDACPACGAALSSGRLEPLAEQEWELTRIRQRDLAFLLSPQVASQPGMVGPRLAHWRKLGQQRVEAIADHLGEIPKTVRALELRRPTQGLKFQNYMASVDYLGLTFETLFNTVLSSEAEEYTQLATPQERFRRREIALVQQVQQAVEGLREQGKPLNQVMVAEWVGMARSSLRRYPRVRALLSQARQEHQQEIQQDFQRREQEWVSKVEQAMHHLRAEGKPVTQVAISRLVGLRTKGLNRCPQVKAILAQVAETWRPTTRQQQAQSLQTLVANVQQAIADLQSQGQPVKKKAVAPMVGVSRSLLSYHPAVRALFPPTGGKGQAATSALTG